MNVIEGNYESRYFIIIDNDNDFPGVWIVLDMQRCLKVREGRLEIKGAIANETFVAKIKLFPCRAESVGTCLLGLKCA